MPPLPSESDLDLDPDLGTPDRRRPPADIMGVLLREVRNLHAEVKQSREDGKQTREDLKQLKDVVMVATPCWCRLVSAYRSRFQLCKLLSWP